MTEDLLSEAYNSGLEHEKAGRLDEAEEAYRRALQLNPEDPGGVTVRLAAMGRGDPPSQAPEAYVAMLFDQHAEVFDGILVDQLGYAVPMTMRERLQSNDLGPFDRMLDLGCGTGLAAVALEDMCNHMTGADLAEGMVEVSDDKDIYDDLYVAEATSFLLAAEEENESWDLIVATDVLPYIGDATAFIAAAASRLTPGGVLTFSTETLPDLMNWKVTPYHRYAHSRSYVEAGASEVGLKLIDVADIVVRHEEGAPIPGHLYVFRKPDRKTIGQTFHM